MKFGIIKTLVENKLVKSFVDKKLDKDMKFFKNELLENKSFKRLYFIYDTLKENKSLDKEIAEYMVDDLSKEVKSIELTENFTNKILKWAKGVIKENNYTTIDDLFYGNEYTLKENRLPKRIL